MNTIYDIFICDHPYLTFSCIYCTCRPIMLFVRHDKYESQLPVRPRQAKRSIVESVILSQTLSLELKLSPSLEVQVVNVSQNHHQHLELKKLSLPYHKVEVVSSL